MKGLTWDDFSQRAKASICRNCECGSTAPYRGNATCLQAWLRFHSSRGILLSCNASRASSADAHRDFNLMTVHPARN